MRRGTLGSLVAAGLAVGFLGESARAQIGSDDLVGQVKSILPDTAGACVLAIDDGRVVFEHAYGLADVENNVACTPATNFRIASVSKQFTAAAIMLLVEQGKVSLDDKLPKFFPGFPEYGREVTVRQLLTHTSGLPDYENLIPEGTTLQLDDLDVLQLLMDAKEPIFAPGAKWQYSNSGYALLGLIVEAAAKKPFHQFLADGFFKPLGMTNTVMYVRGFNEVPNRAYGHEKQEGRWVRADQSLTSAVRGDGGVYTSLDDYKLWLGYLNERKLFRQETYREIFSPQVETSRDAAYGFGWFIDRYRDQRRVCHNGESRGFTHTVQTFPDRRAAIVLFTNSALTEPMNELGQKLADLLIFDRETGQSQGN